MTSAETRPSPVSPTKQVEDPVRVPQVGTATASDTPPGEKRRQQRFLRAYSRYGTYAAGCKAAGVSWNTARVWMLVDDQFRWQAQDAFDRFIDRLRALLYAKAAEGHAPSLVKLLRLAMEEHQESLAKERIALQMERDWIEKELAKLGPPA